MEENIYLSPRSTIIKKTIIIIFLITLFVIGILILNLDMETFITRGKDFGKVLVNFFKIDFGNMGEIISELLLSISIAMTSLIVGIIFSLILSLIGASNLSNSPLVSYLIKGFVSIIRAIPSLVWILMIVASLGFGSLAGVIGLIFPTVGYLAKSFISSIEEVPAELLETLKSTGAKKTQIIMEGVIPYVSSIFLTWIAIRLESNVAESISLGMVGAGGIGTLLTRAIGGYQYAKITTIILVIFIVMLIIEIIVNHIKLKFN